MLAALVLAHAARARAADEIVCPPTIAVESRLPAAPPSWDVGYGDAKSELMSVTFYDGPLSEGASLVYDQESKAGKTWVARWKFAPNNERGYWISCAYTHTNAILSKKLPAGIAACQVTYDQSVMTAGLPTVKSIACK